MYPRYDATMTNDTTTDPAIAFVSETHDPPALEIRVNFGVFAGRAATQAEIDDLAKELLPELHEVTIVGEERHEISEDVEAALHQVRIEVDGEHPEVQPAQDVGQRPHRRRLPGAALLRQDGDRLGHAA